MRDDLSPAEKFDQRDGPERIDPEEEGAKEVIRSWVEVQREEHTLRREELDFRKMESKQSYEYSLRALDKQAEFLGGEQRRRSRVSTKRYIFAGSVIFLVLVFAAMAMFLDKDALALEVLKYLVLIAGGGGGGYALGLHNRAQNAQQSEE